MQIEISIENPLLRLSKQKIKKAVESLFAFLHIEADSISIHFVGKQKISLLHKQFFQDSSITDCITFPIDPLGQKPCFIGEIYICLAVAIDYAKKHNIDPYDEAMLYLIHGVLHLTGLNDKTKKEIERMRMLEKRCMDHLIKQGFGISFFQEKRWKEKK